MWINQSCFSLGFLSRSSLYFVGIRVFIVGYEMECEKLVYSKTWCTGESLHDWDKSWVPVASYQTRPDCTFCPVVIQLAWLFNFLHASHVCFILASYHSWISRDSLFVAHSWSNLHILSYTTLTLFPPKYRVSKCWITSKFGME